jgi:small GTP-binding protein
MGEPLQAFRDRRRSVIEALDQLRIHAEQIGATTLAGRMKTELCDKLAADQFNLVVVGEFNHGKTTLVNALLGEAVLPVGVTPTTAAIHHVRHAPEPEAAAVYADGTRRPVPLTELGRFGLSGEDDGAGEDDDAELHHLDIGYPSDLLRERIVLVDTPGVNDLCLQRAEVTFKYIPQSDAVLFVIDAGQPLKESERVFLRDKLIGQSRDKIIFVVSKVDIWSDAEQAEALAYVRSELSRLVDKPVLLPVSPERALDGERAASGMDALVAHLTAFLADERGRIVLDNALGEGLGAARAIARSIDARRRAAQMSAAEIDRRIASVQADLAGQQRTLEERRSIIREEVAAIRAWVRRDLDRFCDDVIRQLPELVDEADLEDVKLYLPGFLESTFIAWAEAETAEIARALEALAEKLVALLREDAHAAATRLKDTMGGDVPSPDVQVDTFGYDVGVFALFTIGLGMMFTNALLGSLLTIAAPVLALYLRGRIEDQTRAKAKEQAATALREAAARVAPKLDEMTGEFATALDAWVVSAGAELHREMIDVLARARSDLGEAAPDAERITAECDGLDEALRGTCQTLDRLRAELWGSPPPAESEDCTEAR